MERKDSKPRIQNSAAYKTTDTVKMLQDMQEEPQQQKLPTQVGVNPFAGEGLHSSFQLQHPLSAFDNPHPTFDDIKIQCLDQAGSDNPTQAADPLGVASVMH
jgi:hypothetical protein